MSTELTLFDEAFSRRQCRQATSRNSMGPYSRFHVPFCDEKGEIARGKRIDIPTVQS